MGIAVKMATKGVPRVRIVVADGPAATASFVTAFEIAAPQPETAAMIVEIGEAVSSRAVGLAVDAVIVRRADQSKHPSNKEGPRIRLLTEGAMAAMVRAQVPNTVLRDGDDSARLYGTSEALEKAAAALLVTAGCEAKYAEAAEAALAALAL